MYTHHSAYLPTVKCLSDSLSVIFFLFFCCCLSLPFIFDFFWFFWGLYICSFGGFSFRVWLNRNIYTRFETFCFCLVFFLDLPFCFVFWILFFFFFLLLFKSLSLLFIIFSIICIYLFYFFLFCVCTCFVSQKTDIDETVRGGKY